MFQEGDQLVIVSAHVQKATRLVVHSELGPRQDLEKLFKGAKATGQRDEPIGELCHQRLALVHRSDDVQVGQLGEGDFLLHELFRYDADDLASGLKCRVGDLSHRADRASESPSDLDEEKHDQHRRRYGRKTRDDQRG